MATACLPWYALPETTWAEDALWTIVASHLDDAGVDAPVSLARNVAIPGVFCDPDLLLAQCCGYDLVSGFAGSLVPLATPSYAAPGCEGSRYRSFVMVREDSPATRLDDLRGATVAINGFNSHSGVNALRSLVAPLAERGRFFGAVRVTGAHLASLDLLRSRAADVMAIDCVLHALLAVHRPAALDGMRRLAETEAAPAPPLVTAKAATARAGRIRDALFAAFADPDSAAPRAALLLDRLEWLPVTAYRRIVEMEGEAHRRDYLELHPTTPILVEG
jgi:ABC-type phosphate/phosphonate transport system substrate-binding protein